MHDSPFLRICNVCRSLTRCAASPAVHGGPVTNAYTESLNSLIRVMNRLGRGYSFEALRAKVLFTEGIHSHKQKRPRFERKREPEPVEMGYGLPDDAIGYGLPVMEKMRPMRAPEAYQTAPSAPSIVGLTQSVM